MATQFKRYPDNQVHEQPRPTRVAAAHIEPLQKSVKKRAGNVIYVMASVMAIALFIVWNYFERYEA